MSFHRWGSPGMKSLRSAHNLLLRKKNILNFAILTVRTLRKRSMQGFKKAQFTVNLVRRGLLNIALILFLRVSGSNFFLANDITSMKIQLRKVESRVRYPEPGLTRISRFEIEELRVILMGFLERRETTKADRFASEIVHVDRKPGSVILPINITGPH